MRFYAAVEAGGTKFNCAMMDENQNRVAQCRIATTTPEQTLAAVIGFFHRQIEQVGPVSALGIASFGPLDLNPNSSTYGYITATPKPGWSNTPLLPKLQHALGCPASIDTDVNGAALAEYRWGAGRGNDVVIYVTVGTGIGGGVVIHGRPLHGLIHPEMGHMLLPSTDDVKGHCPFHGNCAEGMASGNAMALTWQAPAESLDADHPAWTVESRILGQFCHNIMLAYSPHKLILGGGVLAQPNLLAAVKVQTATSLMVTCRCPMG